jgi:hypothetical protein
MSVYEQSIQAQRLSNKFKMLLVLSFVGPQGECVAKILDEACQQAGFTFRFQPCQVEQEVAEFSAVLASN